MWCYCNKLLYEGLSQGKSRDDVMNVEFENGETYCVDWLPKYRTSNFLIFGIPVVILFINWVSKTILRIMTRFENNQDKSKEVYASAKNMFLLYFINSGLIILLVNFRLTDQSIMKWFPIPILEGKY